MDRYYTGDIEGTFGLNQSSYDAQFFGGETTKPDYFVVFYFTKKHLPDIEEGIKLCKNALGDSEEKLDSFFCESDGSLADVLGISESEADDLLIWYWRLQLGREILECVRTMEECYFEATLY